MTSLTVSDLMIRVDGRLVGGPSGPITDVEHDSRRVGPGVLFVAIRGSSADGHEFVGAAVERGAAAVCVEEVVDTNVPQIVVPDTRAALGLLASAVHDDPSRSLKVVGVTGTNGKTTVTHYIHAIASGSGLTSGLIGTIHTRIGGRSVSSERTTPEASDLQRLLGQMRDSGCALVALEVSSHALELGRVAGTCFDVAAFTNLSQDHLDFHGDMAGYRTAKRRLFTDYEIGTAVINIDDETGRGIAAGYDRDLITVGGRGDVTATDVRGAPGGTTFVISSPWGSASVSAPIVGLFNVSNALVATASCVAAGVGFDDVVAGLERLPPVPGRFELVSEHDPITVIVDYAHTPEGIEKTIETARSISDGEVIALVGAGGDRDRVKRPMMGTAASGADLAVITSDNPRSEDPQTIIDSIVSGISDRGRCVVVPDRALAIETAVAAAHDGDVVLILGKGHEPVQEIGGERLPFDDRAEARRALAQRRSTDSTPAPGSMSA